MHHVELTVEMTTEMMSILRDVVQNDGGVRYEHEDDEVGTRACCHVVEYKPHEPTCFVPRASTLLSQITLAAGDTPRYHDAGVVTAPPEGVSAILSRGYEMPLKVTGPRTMLPVEWVEVMPNGEIVRSRIAEAEIANWTERQKDIYVRAAAQMYDTPLQSSLKRIAQNENVPIDTRLNAERALNLSGTSSQQWRWVDEQGRAMTEWSDKPAPPVHMREAVDEKGRMVVAFRPTPVNHVTRIQDGGGA